MGRQAFYPRSEAREASRILGIAVRRARIERGWTQAQLAIALGASRRTIQHIEAGEHTVSVGHAFSAAGVLGIPLFDLDRDALARSARDATRTAALLPARVMRPTRRDADGDDF